MSGWLAVVRVMKKFQSPSYKSFRAGQVCINRYKSVWHANVELVLVLAHDGDKHKVMHLSRGQAQLSTPPDSYTTQ